MVSTYTNPEYPYRRSPDQDAAAPAHHPVIIVGGGPAGLAAAMDLALQGIATVVLDDNNTVSVGSRAICIAKRTLEICDRYSCAGPMLAKGVTWNLGRVYFGEQQIYEFNLLPEQHHKIPAFINLQQYYFEEYMVDRCRELPDIDLRWLHKVVAVDSSRDATSVEVQTPEGNYRMSCDYLLVADGANSPIRESLGLESKGQVFEDRFLIADILMKADFPAERRFWFDAPFHPDQSTLLHKQADNVWRIDFQLGWDADPEKEKQIDRIRPRIEAMLGKDREWELEWASVYTFRCRKMDSFIHNRVIFMGDAAHQVSPFGARGANGALQGVENLCWKLAAVLEQRAPAALLTSYDSERQHGARENILHSTRATDFMTPKNHVTRVFRDTVLDLARDYPFARRLVNSGRLSVPCVYDDSPLNTPDSAAFGAQMRPGSACTDAPISAPGGEQWLLEMLGNRFVLLASGQAVAATEVLEDCCRQLQQRGIDTRLVCVDETGATASAGHIVDREGILAQRYDLRDSALYLIRPDQHVCARWRDVDPQAVVAAVERALGATLTQEQAA
ncbi:FAD-dependent oxidoreductase [Kineobactrum salinum]|uniref:FAD-dependent oxidoreductase n=1 Tax=Kineobactrum salinum TaxID=2708301 RepID=A0A6C0TY45_9GAMM|nr:FAD-dependent oxidoreductase [Kineobactrum salinum]QIB64558.1 FAD-dependent oxidoreductase [Kineobactrum salinum]